MKKILIFYLFINICLCVDVKFEVYRSAKLELNKTSHEQSDLAAFHSDNLNVRPDLDEEKVDENKEEPETHPIDFNKVNKSRVFLNEDKTFDNKKNDLLKLKLKNFFFKKSKNYENFYKRSQDRIKSLFSSRRETNSILDKNFFSRKNIFDFNSVCVLKNFLPECLKKKLSTKFFVKFKKQKSSFKKVIDDLNYLSSSLELSIKTKQTLMSFKNIRSTLNELDKTFYNPEILNHVSQDCLILYEKNCKKE